MEKKTSKNKLLVVVAHPDDEVLGCGATVRLRVDQGCEAKLIIMTTGISGREQNPNNKSNEQQIKLQKESKIATSLIGFSEVFQFDFPDNRMDQVSRNDLYLSIYEKLKIFQPDLVITHHPGDYNWDHTLTFDAVMMAARSNYPENFPTEIMTFETLSSTERAWQDPSRAFHPNIFIDVEKTIKHKKAAMEAYHTEYRTYPHPRSVEGIEFLARKRGCEVGLPYVEAFHLIRKIEKNRD